MASRRPGCRPFNKKSMTCSSAFAVTAEADSDFSIKDRSWRHHRSGVLVQALQMRGNIWEQNWEYRQIDSPARGVWTNRTFRSSKMLSLSCAAANWCCVDMTTEAFQRFRAIQTNNESLQSVLPTRIRRFTSRLSRCSRRRFTHSTNSTLRRRLTAVTIIVLPSSMPGEIHLSDSPRIPIVTVP